MKTKQPQKKLISFFDHPNELQKIQDEINNGWAVTTLCANGKTFVGIMEKQASNSEDIIYIPPRKKIKITNVSA